MTLTVGEMNGIPSVKLVGRLDFAGAQEINAAFLQNTAGRGVSVIVDLSGVDWMASVAIRLFLEAAKSLTQQGKRLILFQAQERVEKGLRAAGIHICMDLTNNADEAVKLANTPGTRMAGAS